MRCIVLVVRPQFILSINLMALHSNMYLFSIFFPATRLPGRQLAHHEYQLKSADIISWCQLITAESTFSYILQHRIFHSAFEDYLFFLHFF